jgi:hypothetical protein
MKEYKTFVTTSAGTKFLLTSSPKYAPIIWPCLYGPDAAFYQEIFFRFRTGLRELLRVLVRLFGVASQSAADRGGYRTLAVRKGLRAHRLVSPKELDRNLWRDLLDRFPNLLGGLCQPVRVDVDADTAAGTGHMRVGLESTDGLFEFLPAVGALKLDFASVYVCHDECTSIRHACIARLSR